MGFAVASATTEMMSFSNAPGEATLGQVAGALAVDEAFVVKDWYVVQAIAQLVALGSDDILPVFSGGTSIVRGMRPFDPERGP